MRPGVGYRSYPPGHYGAGYGVPRYGYGYGYGRGYYFPYYAYGYGAGYYGSSAGGYVAAPAAYGPRPSPWAFGLGVTASALSIGSGEPAADGLGLVARFRGPTLGLEVELGQDRFNDDLRRDTHVGGAFIIPLLGHEVQPYVLVGGGLNVVHFNDTGSDLSQAYLTAGGGLQVHVGQRFDISGAHPRLRPPLRRRERYTGVPARVLPDVEPADRARHSKRSRHGHSLFRPPLPGRNFHSEFRNRNLGWGARGL